MRSKWEELAGETGTDVESRRWRRMFKLGGLGLRVSASSMAQKVAGTLLGDGGRGNDGRLSRLHRRNAEKVVKVLGQLKGASMKLGQMLSNDPDMVPAEYLDVLSTLQRNAPPMTYKTVKGQIEKALDRPMEAVFRYFDPEPIGAASIGQVHRGILTSGEDVAVKVQYPGIPETLQSDFKNLATLMSLGRAVVDRRRLDEYLAEVRQLVEEEADYVHEAAQLGRFHEVTAGRPGVRVPRPIEEWTRPSVLVMEYVGGIKLDVALSSMRDDRRRQELLGRWVALYAWMFHELLELHADPHPGNFLLDADDNLVVLDFGCVKAIPAELADGILDILVACWVGDDEEAARAYQRLGFGKEGAKASIYDPALLRTYHEIVLAPFLRDEAFDFGPWRPRAEIQRFVLRNPGFLKLVPPADALMYFRVLSGIKGLLGKLGASLNVHRMAVEVARNRGRLPDGAVV